MSDILLGTCGWSYAEWEGILYPYAQNKMRQYSSIFPTAEIDSTFYSLPKEGMVLGWARNTPETSSSQRSFLRLSRIRKPSIPLKESKRTLNCSLKL
jgi:hypothetical protein